VAAEGMSVMSLELLKQIVHKPETAIANPAESERILRVIFYLQTLISPDRGPLYGGQFK
jgi:hypothetical protein